MSEEEIAVELQSQGVTCVKRFTRKDHDRVVHTKTYLLTFSLPKVPSSLKAGYFNIGVDVYIPNPLRCYKCQKFGHGARSFSTPSRKVDSACQTDICWVSDNQTLTHSISGDGKNSSTSASQTEIQPEQLILPQTVTQAQSESQSNCEPETEPETVQQVNKTKHLTNRERKQLKKKELKALKHIEVPSPLTIPVEVHNSFEPLDMDVTPSPPIQRRGPSPAHDLQLNLHELLY
ncbi:uncharacterized protein LOC125372735 [Haliotis rufescens]|uniref:uncharacterized protein LOC125372735 n=1 Tax=Haliotis rufescens TaxID=6454 RepID=UPI00201ED8CE|nr:uncharacterized protein LOC125372735 [Haliotis rufescens]